MGRRARKATARPLSVSAEACLEHQPRVEDALPKGHTMAQEHVVLYKDAELGEVQLDLNNGYVYDRTGSQIAKWSVTDQEFSGALADHASDQMLAALCGGIESATHLGSRGSELARHDSERARSILASGWDGERFIKMDLGTSDVHQPMPLPNYAAGYRNQGPLADVYAPPILVNEISGSYYTFAKEDAFQRAQPTVGGTSAQVNEIAPRIANSPFTTVEYALGGFVGTQLGAAADAPLRIRQATMTRVVNALLLEREVRVSAKALNAAIWDTSVVTTIAAGAKWNGGASSNPITDLHTQIRASWGVVSAILMSEKVWHAFQESAQVQKYIQFKSGVKPIPNESEMASILELPPIYVSRMKYINSTGALDYVWGNSVALIRQPTQMPPTSQDDVSSGVTFRWNGAGVSDGTASNGMVVREYFVQDRGSAGGNKVVLLHRDAEVQTSAFAGGLIANAYQ